MSAENPEDVYFREERASLVRDVILASLPQRQLTVVCYRYGFHDGIEWRLKDIAAMLKVTPSRVSALHGEAMRSLRSPRRRVRAYLSESGYTA